MPAKKKKPQKHAGKKKPQGHYCKVCEERKANEAFSGKGHAAHICKACAALPVAERSQRLIVNKIGNMAYRSLSKEDIKWLRSKRNDPNPAIQQAAREVHGERFPEYERTQAQKGLTVRSLDFFIHDTVWDEYGDEVPVHIRFVMENTGAFKRVDYATGDETEIQVDKREAHKFLKSLIHEWHVLFWDEDFSDEAGGVYEDVDSMSEYWMYDGLDDEDDEDDEDVEEDEHMPAADNPPDREPILSMRMALNNGKDKVLTFYNQLHQEPTVLFWELEAWFDEEQAIDDFDEVDEDDGDAGS